MRRQVNPDIRAVLVADRLYAKALRTHQGIANTGSGRHRVQHAFAARILKRYAQGEIVIVQRAA